MLLRTSLLSDALLGRGFVRPDLKGALRDDKGQYLSAAAAWQAALDLPSPRRDTQQLERPLF